MALKTLQIDREHYWRALCEVPAHYTHHLSQDKGIQWHQSPNHGFDRVGRKLPQKPDVPVLKEVQCGI